MSTTTVSAAPTYPEPAELRAAASEFKRMLEYAENAVYAVNERVAAAGDHEGDGPSVVTFDYLGRYVGFVQSLRHDLAELTRDVERAESLVETVALNPEFEGPDAR